VALPDPLLKPPLAALDQAAGRIADIAAGKNSMPVKPVPLEISEP
jgi:hypothetical protein